MSHSFNKGLAFLLSISPIFGRLSLLGPGGIFLCLPLPPPLFYFPPSKRRDFHLHLYQTLLLLIPPKIVPSIQKKKKNLLKMAKRLSPIILQQPWFSLPILLIYNINHLQGYKWRKKNVHPESMTSKEVHPLYKFLFIFNWPLVQNEHFT